jgi:hypothetical protein
LRFRSTRSHDEESRIQSCRSRPQIFKVSAGIDWLDLKISLSRLTQHRYVQEELLKITGLKLWVEPCGLRISKLSSCEPRPDNNVKTWVKPMISSTNDTFRIRFHDLLAKHGGKLEAALKQLQNRFPLCMSRKSWESKFSAISGINNGQYQRHEQ